MKGTLRRRLALMLLILLLVVLNFSSLTTVGVLCPSTKRPFTRPVRQLVTLRACMLPWWCRPGDDDEGSIARQIEDAFNKYMACQDLPLFVDFQAYAASLPVREIEEG